MNNRLILRILLCFFVISCNRPQQRKGSINETPKALQEKTTLDEIKISRSRGEDLVGSLYQEQVDKDPELKSLETRISSLPTAQRDSLKVFSAFDEKNKDFYFSANSHGLQIKDSVLREKMKNLIRISEARYKDQIAQQSGLIRLIQAKENSLEDLHQVLKLARTLPIIGQYQRDQIPSPDALQNILKQYEEVIQTTDSQTKK